MHWAECYHGLQFYMQSAKMHHRQSPHMHPHQHRSLEWLHGAPQPGHGSCLKVTIEFGPLSTPIAGWSSTRQCWCCFLPPRETPLKGFVPVFLLSASFNLLEAGPSCPTCQIIPWSEITTAKQLQLELSLNLQLQKVPLQPKGSSECHSKRAQLKELGQLSMLQEELEKPHRVRECEQEIDRCHCALSQGE